MDQTKSTLLAPPEYRPNSRHGLARRIATFLDHEATHRPRVMIEYRDLARRVLGLQSRPARYSKLTLAVRDEMYRARDLLVEVFHRELVTNGTGARATIDADEQFDLRLGNDLLNVARRVAQYGRAARRIRELGVTDEGKLKHLRHAEQFALDTAKPLRLLVSTYYDIIDPRPGSRAADAPPVLDS